MPLMASNVTYRNKSSSYSFINEKNGNTNKSIDLLNIVQTLRERNT